MKPRILFLNPPGKELYIRDYYCSKVSKANYLPQPVDLLIQTSFFDEVKYELKVIDAIAEQYSIKKSLQLIIQYNPDVIMTMCGSVSLPEDEFFFGELKNQLKAVQILASGDLFLEDPTFFLHKYQWLDAIITNFFNDSPLRFIEGEKGELQGFVHRGFKETYSGIKKSNDAELIPKHHLFNNKKYRMPFATGYPIATVLSNYACPFPCTFCIMSTLGFQNRTVASVLTELRELKRMGIKFIYFSDQTFFVIQKHTSQVLDAIINENMGFEWMCFSRVDVLDEDKMIKMKKAGCITIMFGVEWSEDEYSQKYKKQYKYQQIIDAFALAKKVGIKRMGTFLLGVPGQTARSIENTIRFAIDLKADYASFNIAVPRAQTSFREEAIQLGLIKEEDRVMDQSGSFIAMGTGELSANEVMKWKRTAYKRFYLRPSYIYKRIQSVRTWEEFKTHAKEGYYMIKSII